MPPYKQWYRYWESQGPSGTHWICVEMQPDVYIEELCLLPQGSDSYRPATLTIGVSNDGGPEDADSFTTVSTINCNHEPKITVLEACAEYVGCAVWLLWS